MLRPKEFNIDPDNITHKRSLGAGGYGTVSEVMVNFPNHTKYFAEKKFDRFGLSTERAVELVEHSVEMFNLCKEFGVPTFKTYRPSPDKTKIYMTLATNNQYTLIGEGSNVAWEKVETVDIKKMLEDLNNIIQVASAHRMELNQDAFHYIAQNTDPNVVQVIIGDFENVRILEIPELDYITMNTEAAKRSAENFLERYITGPNLTKYKEELQRWENGIVPQLE